MARELERRVVSIVQEILRADLATSTPVWLMRPGKEECGTEWDRVSRIYSELTGLTLPEVMRSVERRTVDAILITKGQPPRILEIDEKQHFNQFRALTLRHIAEADLAFDRTAWLRASNAKRKLEGGGFARPMAPLFPGQNGRHRQRAFRDALCDLLPPLYGFAPTLRIADFEVKNWIDAPEASGQMAALLAGRLGMSRISRRKTGDGFAVVRK